MIETTNPFGPMMIPLLRSVPDLALMIAAGLTAFAASVLAHALARRCGMEVTPERSSRAFEGFKILLPVTGVLLSFSLIQARDTFRKAELAVGREASTINQLDRLLSQTRDGASSDARRSLILYAKALVDQDWPAMRAGLPVSSAAAASSHLNDVIQSLQSVEAARPQLYGEILRQLEAVNDARDERLDMGSAGLSNVLWEVCLTLSAITLLVSAAIGGANRTLMVCLPFTALAIVGSLLFALDQPFKGQTSVSPAALTRMIALVEARRASGLDSARAVAPTNP